MTKENPTGHKCNKYFVLKGGFHQEVCGPAFQQNASLPSSPHVEELREAFDLEAENDYGKNVSKIQSIVFVKSNRQQ